MDDNDTVGSRAERVVALEAELESAGEVAIAEETLRYTRAALHAWVDSVVAVVSSPGVGRVTLIHADGSQSGIASPTLPFLLSRPARFGVEVKGG
ncbi:MAG: hypothetical protein Q8R44_11575 [Novosphingobium sp.]|nr:hypothetical protein [Novosphingobium sp.]